jgi:hypothetical protein
MDERISLCLTLESPNKSICLLRIADYINGSLVPFSFNQNDIAEDNTLTISVNPREAKIGELCIWRWKPREDKPNKQLSYKTSLPFWCLLFSSDIDTEVWDKNVAVKLLKNGFNLPINLPDSFLLKVWESGSTIRVIYLQKKDLIILGSNVKLNNNVETVKCFNIPKTDFIFIDDLKINNNLQKMNVSNIFYKFTELPEAFELLSVKTFEERLLLFLNTYAKSHGGLSRKERNAAKDLLLDFISNKDELNTFINEINNYYDNSVEIIEELKQVIDAYFTENGYADQLLTAMVENIPTLREKYIQYVREKWLSEMDDERVRLEACLKSTKQELEKAKEEYKRTYEEKELIEREIDKLKVVKYELEQQIYSFQQSFREKINSAREEIASFLAEVAVYQGSVGIPKSQDASIYRFVSELNDRQGYEKIEEINDLLYLLEVNLQKAGVMEQYKEIASQFVACSVLSGRPLLVIGCNARAFADAVSATVCALPADILTLPVSFRDIEDLKLAVSNSRSDVVLIENAVLGCDENVYLPLTKEKYKKLLLFSVDFEDNMSLLPKSILHFMNLLDLDIICENTKEEDYKLGKIETKLYDDEVSIDKLYRFKKVLKNFSKVDNLSPIYIQQRSEYLTLWEALGGKPLVTLLICELIPYYVARGKQEELQDFIREQQLPNSVQRLLDDLVCWM